MSQKHLPAISVIGGVITLAGFFAWAVAFLAMAPKMSVQFVFTELINSSGYTNVGWVGIMSFYTPVYALYGTDGILHLAEEMKDPATNAPVCIPPLSDVKYIQVAGPPSDIILPLIRKR